MKPAAGIDLIAATLGNPVGFAGTATATSATSLTTSGLTASAYVGMTVVAGSVYGVVTANTTTVITVERWVNPATPGGAAGTTPGSTSAFVIFPSSPGAAFMALTANSTAPASGDTSLSGEITTGGGGLVRKLCSYAHTAGTATYTLAATFTANGSDALPVTVAKVGMFPTLTGASGVMVFETLMSSTATLSASGDQVTNTQTVTIS